MSTTALHAETSLPHQQTHFICTSCLAYFIPAIVDVLAYTEPPAPCCYCQKIRGRTVVARFVFNHPGLRCSRDIAGIVTSGPEEFPSGV